jgi:hypothetical protein
MAYDITDKLVVEGVKTYELEAILSVGFGNGKQISSNEVVYYESDPSAYGVLVEYKDDQIVCIKAGPGLASNTLDSILDQIHSKLLVEDEYVVAKKILFNSYPTEGYFRLDEIFQLRPVPANAPLPNAIVADHPGVLEFSFKDSSIMMISNLRAGRKGAELGLVLHAFIEGAVKLQSGLIRFCWVRVPEEFSPTKSYAYCQAGYSTQEVPGVRDSFTKNDKWEPMEKVEPSKYYDRLHVERRGLQVPSDLGSSIKKFYSLNDEQRSKFLRACYWSHLSCELSELSKSAAYIAKVNAIEALTPDSKVHGKCKECDQVIRDGSTKVFVDFLETFAPDSGAAKRAKRKLYGIRSKLVHSGQKLSADLFLDHAGLHPRIWESMEDFRELSQIVRTALYKWLHAQ